MAYKVMLFENPINSSDAHARTCLNNALRDYSSLTPLKPMGIAVNPKCYYKICWAVKAEGLALPVLQLGGALTHEIWFRIRPAGFRLFRPGEGNLLSPNSCIDTCSVAAGIQPSEARVSASLKYKLVNYSSTKMVNGISVPMPWGKVSVFFDADVPRGELWLKE